MFGMEIFCLCVKVVESDVGHGGVGKSDWGGEKGWEDGL